MAFFDFITMGFGGTARQIQAHAKRLANRNAQNEDREASAKWLANNGSEEALLGMFGRFEITIEHGLKDKKEKELVFDLLVGKGEPVAELARKFALSSVHFQYAVLIVEQLKGHEKAVELLLELSQKESIENELKPEKKRTLMIALAERKDPRIIAEAERFLMDYDESVRAGAVEALAAQEGEEAVPLLLKALCNRKEESTRIRGRIAEAFEKHGWSISLEDPWLPNHLPGGYRLDGDKLKGVR
jgi:hypothetical protein